MNRWQASRWILTAMAFFVLVAHVGRGEIGPAGLDDGVALASQDAAPAPSVTARAWERDIPLLCEGEPANVEEKGAKVEEPGLPLKAGVNLSAELAHRIVEIGASYRELTDAGPFVVTDGLRTATAQAALMYDNLQKGDDLRIYLDQETVGLVKIAYAAGVAARESAEITKSRMADAIAARANEGHLISGHLNGTAFDIGKDGVDQEALETAAATHGYAVLEEPDHFHLQPNRDVAPRVVAPMMARRGIPPAAGNAVRGAVL
jgi:hypothetical protein